MFHRLVADLKFRAVAAREISLGVLDAFAFLTKGRSGLDEVFYEHHSTVVKELPGF